METKDIQPERAASRLDTASSMEHERRPVENTQRKI
jgi:protein kinase A